jgi:geranylgeranyl diphosphate synthase type II
MASGTQISFEKYALDRRGLIEDSLTKYLQGNDPADLYESIRYSVLSSGKRIRALLCLAAFEAIASKEKNFSNDLSKKALTIAMPCACAIEMVHAMSLIHDDLPIMDNDDFRRGKPTNHKVFGEAMALLAGDALLVLASEILLKATKGIEPSLLIDVQLELVKSVGAQGMVGGQVEDLKLTGQIIPQANNEISQEKLENLHNRKTGALLSFSAWSGARLAGANEKELALFKRYGQILGLAFQIADDLLDVRGDAAILGKTPGKDIASNKATWVTVFGEKASIKRLDVLQSEANDLLKQFTQGANSVSKESIMLFVDIFDFAIRRSN